MSGRFDDYLTDADLWPTTPFGRLKLAARVFISPEEALRRTPESDVDETPKLVVAGDFEWELAMREAERLENEGGAGAVALATSWRVRAICRALERGSAISEEAFRCTCVVEGRKQDCAIHGPTDTPGRPVDERSRR